MTGGVYAWPLELARLEPYSEPYSLYVGLEDVDAMEVILETSVMYGGGDIELSTSCSVGLGSRE
jgi:hypothetical protein